MPSHEVHIRGAEYLPLKPHQARAVSNGTLLRETEVSVLDGYLALQVTMRERTERHTTIAARHRAESPEGVAGTA